MPKSFNDYADYTEKEVESFNDATWVRFSIRPWNKHGASYETDHDGWLDWAARFVSMPGTEVDTVEGRRIMVQNEFILRIGCLNEGRRRERTRPSPWFSRPKAPVEAIAAPIAPQPDPVAPQAPGDPLPPPFSDFRAAPEIPMQETPLPRKGLGGNEKSAWVQKGTS